MESEEAGNRKIPTGSNAISRRDFLKLSGAGLAGVALLGAAGCGGSGGQQGSGPVNLVFSRGPDPSGTIQKVIDQYNQQNQGKVKVTWRQMPADTDQYFQQLRTEFQAGGGGIDVIGGDVIWPAQLAVNGWIADLSSRFTEDMRKAYLPGPIQANTYQGKIYGVPWFSEPGLLFYRKDLLTKSGFSNPPKTWDELKSMAKKVQQDSGTKYGFVFQGAQYEGGVVDGLEYIWTSGGDVLDSKDPTKVVINSPQAINGLSIERSMITDGVSPEAVSTYKEMESHTTFLNGDTVFMRNWPYVYGLLSDPKQSKITAEQVGASPLPVASSQYQSTSALGGYNLFMNSASKNQDAAWQFIQYLSAPEQQKTFALDAVYLPTRTALYQDQEILSKVPVAALVKDAIQNARPRPVSPYYSDMSLKMAEQFNASLKGSVSPEQAIQKLQGELQNIIKQGKA